MSEETEVKSEQTDPPRKSNRLYIILAVVLVVVIVVAAVLLITVGLPALRGDGEQTVDVELTPTLAPTFTPGPTREPTHTPPPPPSPTAETPIMLNTDEPIYEFVSAGARPGKEWTGFFGVVQDAQGNPVGGVPVIIWYRDGTPASPVVKTDDSGSYEIRLADAPLAGEWSIQLLIDDGQPASKSCRFGGTDRLQLRVERPPESARSERRARLLWG